MKLASDHVLLLDHRAYMLQPAFGQPILAAGGLEGRISLVGGDWATREINRQPAKLGDLCVHPTQPILGLIEEHGGAIWLISFDGSPLCELPAPASAKRVPPWGTVGFHGVFFDLDEEHLWCASSASEDMILLQLRRVRTGEVTAETTLEDPFGTSSGTFYATGKAGSVALWIAAGQDGQKVYWLTGEAGGISAVAAPGLEDTFPPAFSPTGRELIVLDQQQRLCRHAFPSCNLLGIFEASEDDALGLPFAYVDDANVLVTHNEGGVQLINTEDMDTACDVELVVPELSAARPGDQGVKVFSFVRFEEHIVFVCRRDGGSGLQEWKDALVCVPVSAIVGP